MKGSKTGIYGKRTPENLLGLALFSLLMFATAVFADEVQIDYIDDDGNTQTLTIDANSSDAENALAATLILEGSKITIILDDKEDLGVIAEAVAAHAPDSATESAIRNTILGVGISLGGRSVERVSETPDSADTQVDTPPLPPPLPLPSPSSSSSLPPPSSSVVSPN